MEGGGGGEKRKRFSKSWGLRASVSFAPFPLPLIPVFFFCSRPNFVDELARKRLLCRLKGEGRGSVKCLHDSPARV